MANFSFDVVNNYDKAEINNVFDQAKKELANRYDLKGTSASLEWLDSDKSGLLITGDNDYHIEAVTDLVRKKLAARNQSQKVLDTSKEPVTSNMKISKEIRFKSGLKGDDAKKITKLIRDSYPKVKAQIQGEEIRITSAKKDELQAVMSLLRKQDFDFPLNFINFR
ncbi:MAG TPA: YajQ family cyclic di-GMP-binding protein [Candidatus Saccharimonadales bacterium]|nr:YajQ family cyclic di-GMP-binding protein [Candidatus Saccharimonadales bacterium]